MKTLSIILMSAAACFGMFSLIEGRKTGKLDNLYHEEIKAENHEQESMVVSIPVVESIPDEEPTKMVDAGESIKQDKHRKTSRITVSMIKEESEVAHEKELDKLQANAIQEEKNVITIESSATDSVTANETIPAEGFELRPEVFSRGKIEREFVKSPSVNTKDKKSKSRENSVSGNEKSEMALKGKK